MYMLCTQVYCYSYMYELMTDFFGDVAVGTADRRQCRRMSESALGVFNTVQR